MNKTGEDGDVTSLAEKLTKLRSQIDQDMVDYGYLYTAAGDHMGLLIEVAIRAGEVYEYGDGSGMYKLGEALRDLDGKL